MADIDEIEYSDDLNPSPLGSSMFEPVVDAERTKEEVKEKSATLATAPLLDDILSWFDKEIAIANSIEGVNFESKTPVESQILARTLLVEHLTESKARLQSFKDSHIT